MFLLFLFFSFCFSYQEPFNQLLSLAGLWKMESARGNLYEEWKVLNNRTLIGKSYKLNGTDTIVLENVLLQLIDTTVYYIPTVAGQNNNQPVTFKMSESTGRFYRFENKQHEFPQQVIYRFVNNDSLVASIEGRVKGISTSSDFHYRRIK